jgi:hypothetical protein
MNLYFETVLKQCAQCGTDGVDIDARAGGPVGAILCDRSILAVSIHLGVSASKSGQADPQASEMSERTDKPANRFGRWAGSRGLPVLVAPGGV